MKASKFSKSEAVELLRAAEPDLCAASAREHPSSGVLARVPRALLRRYAFASAWMILWLFVALSHVPPARAQHPLETSPQLPQSALRAPLPTHKRPRPLVERVEAVGITVSDLDVAVDFYTKVLSFEKVSDVEVVGEEYEQLQGVFGLRMRVVRLRLGSEFLELTEYLAPRGKPVPIDSRSNDHWFQHVAIITSDMDKAYARLRQNKVQHTSTGPQTLPAWNKNAGGIRAFYFKDPDGHSLEILQFPSDKGADKWRRPGSSGQLFLGIDHTAIVVSDTEASLRFYRDALGLAVAGESENYGTEQEHLNNVFGARLRITSLRAAGGGPGIEFLEYLAPGDGRPAPVDKSSNDLIHWQTILAARNVERVAGLLSTAQYGLVSSGVTTIKGNSLGFKKGLLVKDPDGHVMNIAEY